MEQSVSRRGFVAGAALTASAAFIAANGKKAYTAQALEPETWDIEADIVVVGFGGSGASAAIAAADGGSKVVVLEKAPESDAGGNFSVCGGSGVLANPENPQMAFDFLRFQMPDDSQNEELEGFVQESLATPQWLEDHNFDGMITWSNGGGSMYATNEYAHGFNGSMSGNGFGRGFYQFLKDLVVSNENIEVHYATPGVKLIFDPETHEVHGVLAMDAEGKPLNVLARQAVILTLGGFENNKQMLNTFYPPQLPIYPCGTPYNTGDGIKMITEIGAKLRGFSSVEWGCYCCKPASEEVGVCMGIDFLGTDCWNNSIMVNAAGKHIEAEAASPVKVFTGFVTNPLHDKRQIPALAFDMETLRYSNLPMFYICDQTRFEAGAMFNGVAANAPHYWADIHGWATWSEDNQAEVEKGWLVKGETLEELAEKLGIDPEGLAATVEAYNAGCAAGVDEEFGRDQAFTPVETGPFYGCELGLGLINTQGGPVRNANYQVISYDDEVIPRLYAGGEFGSMYTWLYQGAGNVSECINSRGAGAHATTLDRWC
ncbi:MAG: FAD-binding protein [Coriobacteriales bacterium]|nr:FAD-binding protein [Coriobacteriales bacterium]